MVFFILNKIILSKPCFSCTYILLNRMVLKKIGVIILIVLLSGCSTQKNTWLSRNYNNLTARYNILHNGNESFRQGEKLLMENQQDNYTGILPLFPYSGAEKAGQARAEMDRAISKGQKLIREKSIKVKPKRKPSRNQPRYAAFYNKREFNRWVDDAYILIGKAHLYNHDFNEALTYFDYTLREFPNHPSRFEAIIWMARTRIEMGDLDNALILLNQYDGMGKAPNRLHGEYMATYADYLIHHGQHQAAISFMVTAADMAQGKWNKSRRNYILAQLYQQSGQYELARERFLKVARSNPEYEMNLNARLNLAILNGHLEGSLQSSRKELYKLVRQSKNREFRDRIYYIMAQSYLNEGDTISAITNLRLAAGYNSGNQDLKGETFLQLAGLYFKTDQYIPSFAYYDSTLMVIKETDTRLTQVNNRHEGLKDLAQNYSIIYTEDSVRRIAAMPSAQRELFIDNLIEQQRLAQLQPQTGGSQQDGSMVDDPFFYRNFSNQLMRQTDSQGQWYFYNPTTVSLGKMDFEKRWGRRASEDNWRRSDKGTAAPAQDVTPPGFPPDAMVAPVAITDASGGQQPGTEEPSLPTKEKLLEGLPLTPEKMAVSDDRLAQAHFNAGMVFFDQFQDYRKAVILFREVVTDFPEHPLAEQAWFWAFRCYARLENEKGMNEMKQGLLSRFPDSRYTAFVADPDFLKKQEEKDLEMNQAYENAYSAYLNQNYTQVLAGTQNVLANGEKEELLRKSHLLRAVTFGKTGNHNAFESELNVLANQYAASAEGALAKRWLAMLAEGRKPVAGITRPMAGVRNEVVSQTDDLTVEEPLMFQFEPEMPHYLILVINSEADVNRLFFNLADYNFSRFLLADYDIESKNLPDGQRIITVGRFANSREVMDYFYAIRENPQLFRVDNVGTPSILAGSNANLTQIISSGNISGYRDFFSDKYLSGSRGTSINTAISAETLQPAEPEKPNYEKTEGAHWGLVVLSPRADRNRVSTFLTNHALNNLRLRVTIKVETLPKGEVVLLIESFENAEQVNRFFSSLENNYFWNTQLGARDWVKTAISPANFEILIRDGVIGDYLEFYKEYYTK